MRRVAVDPILTADSVPPARLCDHPGCECGGEYRAPRSRLELDSYYWFCLDHVRAYNLAWNYYAGMSETEIEAEIRRDTTWQRPTWKLGMRHGPAYEARVRDPFRVYEENTGKAGRQQRARSPGADASARVASAREQALAVFDLDPPFTQSSLKARYKVLVKMHHPDAHGGDKAAEEKLKIINQAYTTLKASYFA
jgi:xanthine/CO dehydrogenase XdhC/CoxF family maturation factor